MLNSTATARAN